MEIKINNKSYMLSKRIARDQLNTIELYQSSDKTSLKVNLVIAAKCISDSLKATANKFKWFQFVAKYSYRRITIKKLMNTLSQDELFLFADNIAELENGKKKAMGKEAQYQESSQGE